MRPTVLSIAGFDPSGGAGILADIKTFENHKVYGFGVCSSLTFQNDSEFDSVRWTSVDEIIKQIEILDKKLKYNIVKIGLIENFDVLYKVCNYLLNKNPKVKIIWDSVLKASAGFIFHQDFEKQKLNNILSKIHLITPNLEEAKILFPENNFEKYNLLLKGGHSLDSTTNDLLFFEGEKYLFEGKRIEGNEKHGTGCILSSAIAANLALGENIENSCKKAKQYVRDRILSNKTLLAYHKV